MLEFTDVSILSRIFEGVPLILSVPATLAMLRCYCLVKRQFGSKEANPFLLLAIACAGLLFTQVMWLLSYMTNWSIVGWIDLFGIVRAVRNVCLMLACIALSRFIMDRVNWRRSHGHQ